MILFVFEGARREPMLFERIKYLFFEKETDTIVYSFGNNIYNLYKPDYGVGNWRHCILITGNTPRQ